MAQGLEDTPAPVKDRQSCCSLARRLEAEVLEDLQVGGVKSQYYVLLAGALYLLILLDPVEDSDLPQAAWVVGARNGSFLGPIPVRATIF